MSATALYYLEARSCPSFVLSGGELDVTLEALGNDPEAEKWRFVSVFDPARMLYGMMIVNARTSKALYFTDPKKPLTVGGANEPINPYAVWSMEPRGDTYWKLSPIQDEGQAIDQGGICVAGAIVQAWGSNDTSHQQWRLINAS